MATTTKKSALQRQVNSAKTRMRNALAKEHLYSKEWDMQLEIVAMCDVKIRQIMAEMSKEGYSLLQTEVSREGNPRYSINPLENLLMRYIQIKQQALRASGLNTDSKRTSSGDAVDMDDALTAAADEWEKEVK